MKRDEKPRSDQTDTKFSILGEYQNGKDIGDLKLNWNRESISIACWFDWIWLDWIGWDSFLLFQSDVAFAVYT